MKALALAVIVCVCASLIVGCRKEKPEEAADAALGSGPVEPVSREGWAVERVNRAKWSEGKAMMGTIAMAIRAYCAENRETPPDNSLEALGFMADDFRGTYFDASMFEFKVSSASPVKYVITATNNNLRPARISFEDGVFTEH
jgi:hypothetical protein